MSIAELRSLFAERLFLGASPILENDQFVRFLRDHSVPQWAGAQPLDRVFAGFLTRYKEEEKKNSTLYQITTDETDSIVQRILYLNLRLVRIQIENPQLDFKSMDFFSGGGAKLAAKFSWSLQSPVHPYDLDGKKYVLKQAPLQQLIDRISRAEAIRSWADENKISFLKVPDKKLSLFPLAMKARNSNDCAILICEHLEFDKDKTKAFWKQYHAWEVGKFAKPAPSDRH